MSGREVGKVAIVTGLVLLDQELVMERQLRSFMPGRGISHACRLQSRRCFGNKIMD